MSRIQCKRRKKNFWSSEIQFIHLNRDNRTERIILVVILELFFFVRFPEPQCQRNWLSKLNHLTENEKFTDTLNAWLCFVATINICNYRNCTYRGTNNKTQSIHASFQSTSYLVGDTNGHFIMPVDILHYLNTSSSLSVCRFNFWRKSNHRIQETRAKMIVTVSSEIFHEKYFFLSSSHSKLHDDRRNSTSLNRTTETTRASSIHATIHDVVAISHSGNDSSSRFRLNNR